jgi:F-type H+-transporting ATPase subunit gamma
MSNLKEIKRRIKSIENIEHVTDAIEKIAATRLLKAKNRMIALRNYAIAQEEMIFKMTEIDSALPKINPAGINLFYIITSDKGLCGGFNTRIIEEALKFINNSDKGKLKLIISGKKGLHYFEKANIEILLKKFNVPVFCTLKDIDETGNFIINQIEQMKISEINILFTEFQSASHLNPLIKKIYPVIIPDNVKTKTDVYIFEPGKEEILKDLFPKYIKTQLLLGYEESIASEHIARMMMMERATKSAKDMIEDLTQLRNKNRQALITKELSEIVGTTNALESNN